MTKNINLILFLSFFYVPAEIAVQAGKFKDPIEVVQSFPSGTKKTLKTRGIRITWRVWVDMVKAAKQSIDIGAFYFANKEGSLFERFLTALKSAAKRGVRVRIIADESQYTSRPEVIDQLGAVEGICIRIIPMKQLAGGVMHAKYMIVDDENFFVGSQNFDWQALQEIREIGIRIRNKPLARTVQAVFEADWQVSKPLKPSQDCFDADKKINLVEGFAGAINKENQVVIKQFGQDIKIYPAFSPVKMNYHNMDDEEAVIVDLIDKAQKEIFVQVMEFSPVTFAGEFYPTLINALERAALRKVQVHMIFANWSIAYPHINFIQALSIIPHIDIKLSTIPYLSDECVPYSRVEHCKYMVVDNDTVWIGTGNWTRGYFYECRNIGLAIKSSHLNKVMRTVFFNDWDGPYTKDIDPIKHYDPIDYQCKHADSSNPEIKKSIN